METDVDHTTLKENIAHVWSDSAPTYDAQYTHGIHHVAEKTAWQTALARLVGSKQPHAKRIYEIVDVGTGTGVMAFLLAELGHMVIGIDIAPGMVAEAQHKAEETRSSVIFHLGDAETLPLVDNSVDVLISRHVFWTLPQPRAALKEWQRVVRDNGEIVIIDGLWGTPPSWQQRIKQRVGRVLDRVTERSMHVKEASYTPAMLAALPIGGFQTYDQITALCVEMGLTDVEYHSMP